MVFSPIHYIPSVISALLIIFLAGRVRAHKSIALIMASFAALGLVGYLSRGEFRFYPLDWHVLHSFFGIIALILTLTVFLDGMLFHKFHGRSHCRLGYIAAFFAILALSSGLYLLSGLPDLQQETPLSNETSQACIRAVGALSPAECIPYPAGGGNPAVSGKRSDALEPAGE